MILFHIIFSIIYLLAKALFIGHHKLRCGIALFFERPVVFKEVSIHILRDFLKYLCRKSCLFPKLLFKRPHSNRLTDVNAGGITIGHCQCDGSAFLGNFFCFGERLFTACLFLKNSIFSKGYKSLKLF